MAAGADLRHKNLAVGVLVSIRPSGDRWLARRRPCGFDPLWRRLPASLRISLRIHHHGCGLPLLLKAHLTVQGQAHPVRMRDG